MGNWGSVPIAGPSGVLIDHTSNYPTESGNETFIHWLLSPIGWKLNPCTSRLSHFGKDPEPAKLRHPVDAGGGTQGGWGRGAGRWGGWGEPVAVATAQSPHGPSEEAFWAPGTLHSKGRSYYFPHFQKEKQRHEKVKFLIKGHRNGWNSYLCYPTSASQLLSTRKYCL